MHKKNTLMIQGCTSDAGKSILTAGLCRVLARKGVKVAPFKPQNMALNSAVTEDEGEIGRAQAVQAQACNLAPHTDMNPVLLKPSCDTGAQVIIHGKAVSNMQAQSFHDYKATAMQAVLQSHERLSSQYETIIVEGAGSPAEINLRENDIANMGFAEVVDCPVILIADIDRGGVFAHLHGTLDLLSKTEQQRVAGFVINRFRGDIKLLEPGLEWLEEKTGKPVFGVLPYLQNFYLDAEDAINSQQVMTSGEQSSIKIVVPVFPRISNHTDFDALRLHPDVELIYVASKQPLPPADLIILPGSKNVRADLANLKENGWVENIQKHLRYGGKVLGICGGYQMLGNSIEDPQGIEDKPGTSTGLGLLNIDTELAPNKQLKQISGYIQLPSGIQANLSGYKIHCGQSTGAGLKNNFVTLSDGQTDGAISHDEKIAGTYVHGLFDKADSANAILQWAGLKSNQAIDLNNIREQQLNRLADCLEKNLSEALFELLGSEKAYA